MRRAEFTIMVKGLRSRKYSARFMVVEGSPHIKECKNMDLHVLMSIAVPSKTPFLIFAGILLGKT